MTNNSAFQPNNNQLMMVIETRFTKYVKYIFYLQRPNEVVAIKAIAKKNLAKSQNLLGKEIKILKVRY